MRCQVGVEPFSLLGQSAEKQHNTDYRLRRRPKWDSPFSLSSLKKTKIGANPGLKKITEHILNNLPNGEKRYHNKGGY
jgi:hypothetical protein